MGRLADLDAVTFDVNGTIIGLVNPVPRLHELLRARGIERPAAAIARAVAAEGKVYAGRAVEAHEPAAFATLQRECTSVFLAELGAEELDAAEFAPSYVDAMRFEVLPGVRESLAGLRRAGLELAVVANFDLTLPKRLEQLGLTPLFSTIVTPADAGAAKPDPQIFRVALERLGVQPNRTLHIGDGASDEDGAQAAGLAFRWAPVAEAVADWL